MPAPSAAPRAIPSLDGWRAIAVGFVLLDHLGAVRHVWNAGNGVGRWVDGFVPLGGLGVRIFFVISGYLISRLLLAERATTGRISLRNFYFRRTFRIAPALLCYLVVITGLFLAGIVTTTWQSLLRAALYVSNYGDTGWLTGHTWSLSVEEQFYALWPLALVLVRRRAWLVPLGVLAVVPFIRWLEFVHYRPETWPVQCHFETVADALASGVCLAFAADWLARRPWYCRWCASPLPLVLVPLLFAVLSPGWNHPAIYTLLSIPFGNLTIALLIDWTVRAPSQVLGQVLNVAALRWVGRLSYSLYLWQQFAFAFTPDRIARPVPSSMVAFTTVPGVIVSVLVLAMLSYYGVEQPALLARARIEYWRAMRKRGPTLSAEVVGHAGLADASNLESVR